MSDDFSTEVEQSGDLVTIYVTGEIDLATAGRLRDALEPHLGPAQAVILDLAKVRFIDSAFLNVLVQARGRLTQDGGSLVLRNPSDAARRILTVAQARGILEADADKHRIVLHPS